MKVAAVARPAAMAERENRMLKSRLYRVRDKVEEQGEDVMVVETKQRAKRPTLIHQDILSSAETLADTLAEMKGGDSCLSVPRLPSLSFVCRDAEPRAWLGVCAPACPTLLENSKKRRGSKTPAEGSCVPSYAVIGNLNLPDFRAVLS